jgi:hypothetical protein
MEARLHEGCLISYSGEIPLPYGISPEQFSFQAQHTTRQSNELLSATTCFN